MIGGVIIAGIRSETEEYAREVVDISFFQGPAFVEKAYLPAAARCAEMILAKLKYQPEEKIQICTGYCLDGIAEWMTEKKLPFTRGKIGEPLQGMIETTLQKYLAWLGFDVDFNTLTSPEKKGFFWWKQVAWLKDGNPKSTHPNPEKVKKCKTGWKTFHVWATMPYDKAKIEAKRAH
jgi:hypothetical protein